MRIAVISIQEIDNGIIFTIQAGKYIVIGTLVEEIVDSYRVINGGAGNSKYFCRLTNISDIYLKLATDYHKFREGTNKPLPWLLGNYPDDWIEEVFRDIEDKNS